MRAGQRRPHPRRWPPALLALLALLAGPGTAAAGTVRLESRIVGGVKGPEETVFTLVFEAAPGETNFVALTPEPGGGARLTDTGAPVFAGGGCTLETMQVAVCATRIADVRVSLDDGADRFAAGGAMNVSIDLRAGPGDDDVTASGGDDRLRGGGGHDALRGAAGRDLIADEDATGLADADLLDGGPGDGDGLDYEGRVEAMTVDLRAGTAGVARETDRVAGFERVLAGRGDDTLLGSDGDDLLSGGAGRGAIDGRGGDDTVSGDGTLAGGDGDDTINCESGRAACVADGGRGADEMLGGDGPDRLRGGDGDDEILGLGGRDTVDGGAGDDTVGGDFTSGVARGAPDDVRGGPGRDAVSGGPGRDRLSGGSGADRLLARDGARDAVACGPGRDVAVADRLDDRAAACERVSRTITARVSAVRTTIEDDDAFLQATVECPSAAAVGCRGGAVVRDTGGRRLDSDTWSAVPAGDAPAVMALPERVERVLRSGRAVSLTLTVTLRDAAGAGSTLRRRVRARLGAG